MLNEDVLNRIEKSASEISNTAINWDYAEVGIDSKNALCEHIKSACVVAAKREATRSAALLGALERIVGEIEVNEYAPMVIIAACKVKAQEAIKKYRLCD